jgi:hypothetical protein
MRIVIRDDIHPGFWRLSGISVLVHFASFYVDAVEISVEAEVPIQRGHGGTISEPMRGH